MQKVTSIPSREERFADSRVHRYAGTYPTYMWRYYSNARKQLSKKYTPYFAALRKDARFAGPRFAAALARMSCQFLAATVQQCTQILNRHVATMPMKDGWEPIGTLAYWPLYSTAAHTALCDPTKIACYPTRADAARGREVVMSPGKFFASVLEPTTPAQVQSMAEGYIASKRPVTVFFIENDETYACDDDSAYALGTEWVRVYNSCRGFSSCMVHFSDSWQHPIRFYARPGNGLSLAYMTHNGEPDGETVARAICNKKAGAYVRCYGDARLASALQTVYKLECDPDMALDGVKCNARTHNDRLIGPYIDGGMNVAWNGTSAVCTITSGDGYCAEDTSGYIEGGASAECDECGDACDEDDLTYSSFHEVSICSHCRENYFTYAYIGRTTHTYVRDDRVIRIDGEAYLDDSEVLDMHGYVYSGYHEEYIHEDERVWLEYMSDYVRLDDTLELDVAHGEDNRALVDDTICIILNGERLTVHEDYDGPRDADDGDEAHNESEAEPSLESLAA